MLSLNSAKPGSSDSRGRGFVLEVEGVVDEARREVRDGGRSGVVG